jgi:DNA-binding helix-hairpin-helix protein with protein kinase domain
VLVYDSTNTSQSLGELLASGGEGTVYPLANKSHVLVKIYHQEIMKKRGDLLKEKVGTMIKLQDGFKTIQDGLSWPKANVYDRSGNWLGYAMRRAEGKQLSRLAHPMLFKQHFPSLDRKGIIDYLLRLAECIIELHKVGVYVGDYNLNNIICDPRTSGTLSLIDCDSYQIKSNATSKFFYAQLAALT